MIFFGELKRTGKKSKATSNGMRCFLHGQLFRKRKRLKLTDAFIAQSGLDNPAIRTAVIKSLFQNYGIVVKFYGEGEAAKPSAPKPRSRPTPPQKPALNYGDHSTADTTLRKDPVAKPSEGK